MKRLFFSLVLAAFIMPAMAQSWGALQKQLNKKPAWQKQDVVVLLDSIGVIVDENGSGNFDIHHVAKIQSPTGALAYRVLKYDYDPLTAFAQFTRVTVYKADGSKKEIDVKKTCDYAAPARAIYWGARQIMIEVGKLEAGDIVDYEINKKGFTYALLGADFNGGGAVGSVNADMDDRFIPPMKGNFYDIVPFWVTYPTISKVYTIDAPKSKNIQYEFYQGQCHSAVRMTPDRQILSFSVSDAMPFQKESNMVDLFDVAPKLMLSSTAEWKDKSLWFNKVNEDFGSFDPLPEAQKKVDELIKGKRTEMEKISVLTHWVADNMRYSGISMGKGEGYTLHNTKMNYTDRCGVCKDKAAMLISFLRMAGFEAYPAMTMAGSRIETIPADHFNHCVVVVKLSNGKYIPLDPTWVPFSRELWSSAEQQQNYLPGVPEGSDLMLTPISAPENHYFRLNVKSNVDANGNLTGEYTVEAEGTSDSSVRRAFTNGYMTQWQNAMENELLRVSPEAKLISVNYGNDPKNYQAAPIKIVMKFAIPNYALTTAEGSLLLKPISGQLYSGVKSYMRINTSAEEKEYGFSDSCSRLLELNETLTLPAGYKMVQAPESESIKSGAADFSASVDQRGNKVSIKQTLTLKKRVYEAEDWSGFRSAVLASKTMSDNMLVFEK